VARADYYRLNMNRCISHASEGWSVGIGLSPLDDRNGDEVFTPYRLRSACVTLADTTHSTVPNKFCKANKYKNISKRKFI